jgi:hypothetical protein
MLINVKYTSDRDDPAHISQTITTNQLLLPSPDSNFCEMARTEQ